MKERWFGKKLRIVAMAFLSLWSSLSLIRAESKATLEIGSEKIGLQEQLTMTITVTGEGNVRMDETPNLGDLQGFRLVAGPSTSSQFQWINGQTSSSMSYTYVLLPTKVGRFELGPFSLSLGQNKLTTNTVSVEVVAESSSPQSNRQGARRSQGVWPPGWPSQEEESEPSSADPGNDIFVAIEPSTRQVYPGQRIDLVYRLYTRYSVSGLQLKEAPALQGFWVEDIKTSESPTPEPATVRGKTYTSFVVKRQAVYANAPGKKTIPTAIFALQVRMAGRDPFSFFRMGGGIETLFRKTDPVEVQVLSFPEAGKPADFANLAGAFTLDTRADKTEVRVGDAIGLTVTLSGTGNLNTVGDLPLPAMPQFQIFSSKSRVQGENQKSQKIWDLVLIPQKEGIQTIPGLRFPYFQPEERQYRFAAADPISIRVLAGAGGINTGGISLSSPRQLTRSGSDINFIRLSAGNLEQPSAQWMDPWAFAVLLVIPPLFNLTFWLYRRHSEKEADNSTSSRSRRAASKASDLLRRLEKSSSELNSGDFHGRLGDIFSRFLSDRFQWAAIELTREQVEERLSSQGVCKELVDKTTAMIEICHFARFAPSAVGKDDAMTTLQKMRELIKELDHHGRQQ